MSPRRTRVSMVVCMAFTVSALLFSLLWLLHPSTPTRAQSQPTALGSVSGTVRDNEGEPLANIVVTLEQYKDDVSYPKVSAISDAAGKYQISGVFPGIYRVYFSDDTDRYAAHYYINAVNPSEATTIAVSGNHVEGIDIALMPGNTGTISITIESNIPLSNLIWRETTLFRQNDEGSWQLYRKVRQPYPTSNQLDFRNIPYGRYRFCISLNIDLSPTRLLCYENFSPDTSESFIEGATDIVVDRSEPISVTLDFSQNSQVQGTVVSPDGTPLSGIKVRLMATMHIQYFIADTVTDAQGHFYLNAPYTGTYWLFANLNTVASPTDVGKPYLTTFYPNTSDQTQAENLQIESSTRMSVTLKLAFGGQVSGQATFPTGDPLYNPEFIVRQERDDAWSYPCTSEFGTICPKQTYDIETRTYTISHIIPGTYRIGAEYDFPLSGERLHGYYGGTEVWNGKNVTVRATETKSDVDIVVGETGFDGAILGTVTYEGTPQAGIEVSLLGWFLTGFVDTPLLTTTTDIDGHYALNGLSVGFYRLMFRDPKGRFVTSLYQNSSLYVSGLTPTPGINFSLSPAGSIRGRIFTPYGKPRKNYRIYVYDSSTPGYYYPLTHYDIVTNEQGLYKISGLTPGTYLVSAHKPPLSPFYNYTETFYPGIDFAGNAGRITVTAGSTVDDINIPLQGAPVTRLPLVTYREMTPTP